MRYQQKAPQFWQATKLMSVTDYYLMLLIMENQCLSVQWPNSLKVMTKI